MAYCEKADVEKFMTSSLISNYSDSTDANVTACIEMAEKFVNAMLSDRYSVPLTETVPTVIKHITAQIACYYLAKRKGKHGDYEDDLNIIKELLKYPIETLTVDSDIYAPTSSELADRHIKMKNTKEGENGIIDDYTDNPLGDDSTDLETFDD